MRGILDNILSHAKNYLSGRFKYVNRTVLEENLSGLYHLFKKGMINDPVKKRMVVHSFGTMFINFTRENVIVINADGSRRLVEPYFNYVDKTEFSRDQKARDFYNRNRDKFCVVHLPHDDGKLDVDNLDIQCADGSTYDYSTHTRELNEAIERYSNESNNVFQYNSNRQDLYEPRLGLITSVSEHELKQPGAAEKGIVIHKYNCTVGLAYNKDKLLNKAAMLFSTEDSGAAGTYFMYSACSEQYKAITLVHGTDILVLKPSGCRGMAGMLTKYESKNYSENVKVTEYKISDILEGKVEDLMVFDSEQEAIAHVEAYKQMPKKLVKAGEHIDALTKQLHKVTKERDALSKDRDMLKRDVKTERNKASNSLLSKFGSMFSAIASVIGAAFGIYKLVKQN